MFRAVPSEEILDLWPKVSPGLEVIRRRCKAPWTIEQIRGHLLLGRATLFVRDEGFVILEICKDQWTQEPYLNAWLMWFKAGEAMKLRDELVAWLHEIKKRERCAWWQFGSPREEWAEVIKPYCTKALVIWRSKE